MNMTTGGSSPRHGFDLERGEYRLLRGRPPRLALAWVAAACGPGSRIKTVRALPGGMSSAVHRVLVEDRTAQAHRLVLRRYVREDWLAEEPDLAEREARILRLVEPSPIPTPRLVAVDAAGEQAGVPAVLMTDLPGHVEWDRIGQEAWLRQLAELLPILHATRLPDDSGIRRYQPSYLATEIEPPRWTRHPKAWQRALQIYGQPPDTAEQVLIHRDYHPGNVLWSRGRISGLVDWPNASLGSPEADVGHCRANLLGSDTTKADRFLALYQDVSGRTSYDPYWDIAAGVDLGNSDSDPDFVLDDWLAAAVAAAG